MYRKFHIDEKLIQEVVARLEELQSIKIERLNVLKGEDRQAEGETKRVLDGTLERFRWAVNSGENEQDENEQITAIDKLIEEEIRRGAGYTFSTDDRVKALRAYFDTLVDKKDEAYKLFAKLVDNTRIQLLAIQFMVEGVLNSATHREKDTKLGMVQDTLDAIIQGFTKIDKDRPWSYSWYTRDLGSWDYARALRDLHHRTSDIKRLEEENEKLRAQLNGGEQEKVEDGVPF